MSYEPRLGDFGVVKTSGFVGKLIRIGTASRWNHALIYIGKDEIVEANPKGVEVSPVSKYPTIAWNRHEDLTNKQRGEIAARAMLAVGTSYSFTTIALIFFRIIGLRFLSNIKFFQNLGKKDGYICSELVAECYRKSGLILINKDDFLVVPGDLAERLVYQ
jgi:uncharacterized protein YycO